MSAHTAELSDTVVPKVCGSDNELGNFIMGRRAAAETCHDAARALLAQVQGHARQVVAAPAPTGYTGLYGYSDDWGGSDSQYGYRPYAQDYGRKFLPSNGSCIYIDLTHLEVCTPECLSAFDHLAASRAMLWLAREAMHRANAHMPDGTTIKVLANNSDGCGNSYGSHLNFLITRTCFDNIIRRKMHYLQFLASFQAAAIVLTGAGKVGSENGVTPVRYQISARADFIETMVSEATTHRRPLVNARDESLSGALEAQNPRLARLHVIMFDHALCHHAGVLRVGMMQVILCMLEQGWVPTRLLLDDPVWALHHWSHDPALQAKAPLINGRQYTAVEFLVAVYEKARRFVDAGRANGLVPAVERIMAIWGECLQKLCQHDMDFLASRIDWVAKQYLLERAASRGNLDAGRLKYLDNLWSSLDPNEGLYWVLEKAGALQKLVDDATIERFMHEPPDDTRAWLRAWALEHVGDGIEDVDWDMLRLRGERAGAFGWTSSSTLYMPDPVGFTRARCQAVLDAAPSPSEGLRALLVPTRAQPVSSSVGTITTLDELNHWPLLRPARPGSAAHDSFDQGA